MALIERAVGPTPIRGPRPDRTEPAEDYGHSAAVAGALSHLGVLSARPLLGAFGSGTYELECGEDRWLVARVADDSTAAAFERITAEQHTLHALAGIDFPAPLGLGVVAPREGVFGRPVLVTSRPPGEPLLARLARVPVEVVGQMGELARLHARLHGPAGAAHLRASAPTPPPSLSAAGLSELLGDVVVLGGGFVGPMDWLVANRPLAGPEALCHGASPPAHAVVFDVEEGEDEGPGLFLADWRGAGLAEPEFDVALALLTFWLSPAMATDRSERRSLRRVREWLRTTYCECYVEVRPLDPERLRYWEAFHAVRVAADIALRGDSRGGFAARARQPTPALGRALLRRFEALASGR